MKKVDILKTLNITEFEDEIQKYALSLSLINTSNVYSGKKPLYPNTNLDKAGYAKCPCDLP